MKRTANFQLITRIRTRMNLNVSGTRVPWEIPAGLGNTIWTYICETEPAPKLYFRFRQIPSRDLLEVSVDILTEIKQNVKLLNDF
jgi:hypothetical protein